MSPSGNSAVIAPPKNSRSIVLMTGRLSQVRVTVTGVTSPQHWHTPTTTPTMPDRALQEALKAMEGLKGAESNGKRAVMLNELLEAVKTIVCRAVHATEPRA